jgi:hypothetical protein
MSSTRPPDVLDVESAVLYGLEGVGELDDLRDVAPAPVVVEEYPVYAAPRVYAYGGPIWGLQWGSLIAGILDWLAALLIQLRSVSELARQTPFNDRQVERSWQAGAAAEMQSHPRPPVWEDTCQTTKSPYCARETLSFDLPLAAAMGSHHCNQQATA